jgi:uncharacterized iron-regulated membrane protein
MPVLNMTARQLWQRVHRWIALSAGVLLVINALTGTALILASPLDHALNANLFQVDRASVLGKGVLDTTRKRLLDEAQGSQLIFRLPREPGESLSVSVRGKWRGTVFLNPATGTELGRRGEYEGFFNFLFRVHSALLAGDTGKAILAVAALCYLVLFISGLYMWWPRRWPPTMRIELRSGWNRALFDIHRQGGAILGILIAVSVGSGAWMAWRPLGAAVNTLAGAHALKPPAIKSAGESHSPSASASLDAIVEQVRVKYPASPVTFVAYAGPKRPVRVRVKLPDDPHPNGLSSVWFHPVTGALLEVQPWHALDPGARATAFIYPLHVGELWGTGHRIVVFITGIALATLGVSGMVLWWRRRRQRIQSRAKARLTRSLDT